ncbi:putative membrane protein [Streptococcus uberis 0140J]|uniref:Membrane protein n=1 Tax=Streptococcus uberis (strain ATCC BAA-854 / 0140J) TaxID=218495 RepID=B9DTX5_STRU0|nr:putative membrane protein [Streptococcus uberis 0140J]
MNRNYLYLEKFPILIAAFLVVLLKIEFIVRHNDFPPII